MNWRKITIGILAALFIFMLAGAMSTHLLFQRAPLNGVGSGSFLLLAGGLVFFAAPGMERARLLIAGLIGYLSEIAGVQSGWLYGRYAYTLVLAPNIFGVPVVMVCAWFVLFGYVKQLVAGWTMPAWLEVLLASVGMMTIDLLIDPLAAHPFNFWRWEETGAYYGIPGQNFLGWLVVSASIFLVDQGLFRRPWIGSAWNTLVGTGILILYTSCAFGYGYWIAGGVGILLLVFQGVSLAFANAIASVTGKINTVNAMN